jgi:hypothetical protein
MPITKDSDISKAYGGSVNSNDHLSINGPNPEEKVRKVGYNMYIWTRLPDGTLLRQDILSSDGINLNISKQYIDTTTNWETI